MPATVLASVSAPLQAVATPGPARPSVVPGPAQLAILTAQLADTAAEVDATGVFPHANFDALRVLGLPGLVVPPRWGGAGIGLVQARQQVAAVAQGEPATALILVMQWMLARALSRPDCRWPQPVRDAVLRNAVTDGALANQLRVEPELGSPARGGLPATVARRTPDGWRITGHKLYTTGIDGLRWLVVWGRTDEPVPRVGQFLVRSDAPGVQIQRSWDHLGMRATGSDEVLLTEVLIPADHAVDLRAPADWSAKPDVEQAAWMNVLLGTLYDAVAVAARGWLLSFLNDRVPSSLGAPLATLPRVQEAVGEIDLLLLASRTQLDAAAAAADAGTPWSAADSGLLKVAVTRNAIAVVDLALRQTGNHGLSRAHPLQRHHRNVLCGRVHTPQDDSALLAAGRLALQR